MRRRRGLSRGVHLLAAVLLSRTAGAEDSAKTAVAVAKTPLAAPSSRAVAQRAAADAATFGLARVLAASSGPEGPARPWAPDPSVATRSIYTESIADAAGTLGLSSAGSRSDERDAMPGPTRVETLGHGDGVADLDAFDRRGRGLAVTHIARARAAPHPDGRTPPDLIQRVVRESFGRFEVCYEAGLRRQPLLAGRVAVKFVIDHRGAVALAMDAGSDLPDADVIACVVRAFGTLAFPESKDSAVTVLYPVVLSPAAREGG